LAAEETRERALAAFRQETKDCRRCGLAAGRTQVVFGAGNPEADVVFVGEAPGFHEDVQGLPFVGAAGKLLDDLLATIGLARSQVYIANVIKCRPPGNRAPTPEEVETCKPYLLRQLDIIAPRVVCTMGNYATQLITGKRTGITKLRATPVRAEKFYVFPLFHPAAALHRGDLMGPLREDFRALGAFLRAAPAHPPAPEPRVEQIELL
jgi:uracil-DNA glycosylase family 4